MNNLERLITTAASMGAALTMEAMGVSSGELSLRQSRNTYGKWFMDAYNQGRIRPCRVEDGRTGTKFFRVVDILALKTADAARAELKL